MMRNLVVLGVAVCLTTFAQATPYWVEYQASSGYFPEQQGWTRSTYGGGALRSFEDGNLVLDSRSSIMTWDTYVDERPGAMDPGPGEVFVMQWRLRVRELEGPYDPIVGVFSDARRNVGLHFSSGTVEIMGEGSVATFVPQEHHAFELRSPDMLSFTLYIDGSQVYAGVFTPPLVTSSTLSWGEGTLGGASLSDWEYFRYGVIPEPSSGCLLLILSFAISFKHRS